MSRRNKHAQLISRDWRNLDPLRGEEHKPDINDALLNPLTHLSHGAFKKHDFYVRIRGSKTGWHFLVVTDPSQREALAELYRKGAGTGPPPDRLGQEAKLKALIDAASEEKEAEHLSKMADSALYLTAHLHEVPILVIPCIEGRAENLSAIEQAALWGAILPATWSFMLAARSRGLGTVLTILHLLYEREAADVLGIPYEQIQQVGLIPVAYTLGTTFKPAARKPLEKVLHWDRW